MNRSILLSNVAWVVFLGVVTPTWASMQPLSFASAGSLLPGAAAADQDSTMTANPFALRDTAVEIRERLFAHAILVKSLPEREATIADVPDEVLLIFNDAVGEEFLALAVIDESGKRVDHHDAKLDFTDRSHLRATVSKLLPGRYTVRYRVLSADGHVVSGKYFFQVQK